MNEQKSYTPFEVEVVTRLTRIEQKQVEGSEWRGKHDKEKEALDTRVASLEESRSHANGAIAVLYIIWTGTVGAIIKKLFG